MENDAWAALETRFSRLGIKKKDLKEKFVRSRGKGGQKVNKVSTCVVLTHKPTGVSVRCEEERSQSHNRLLARHRLADKLESHIKMAAFEKKQKAEKLRRSKRQPSRAAKKRNVERKRRRGQLKKLRRKPRLDD